MKEEPPKESPSLAESYPDPDFRDHAQTIARAAVSAIPLVGGSVNELLSGFFDSPVGQRRDQWLRQLAGIVEELTPKKLAGNQVFVSAAIQATRVAIGTHRDEKRQYLRNALLKIGMSPTADGTKEEIILNAIDSLSPAHVKALDLIWRGHTAALNWDAHNVPIPRRNYIAAIGIVAPEVSGQNDLIEHIIHELLNRGFSSMGRPDYPYPQSGMATNLGIEFLGYILNPPAAD